MGWQPRLAPLASRRRTATSAGLDASRSSADSGGCSAAGRDSATVFDSGTLLPQPRASGGGGAVHLGTGSFAFASVLLEIGFLPSSCIYCSREANSICLSKIHLDC